MATQNLSEPLKDGTLVRILKSGYSRARIAEDPDAEAVDATVVLMQCEGPKPKAVARRGPGESAAGHR